jgi:UPF0716 protein FxsA
LIKKVFMLRRVGSIVVLLVFIFPVLEIYTLIKVAEEIGWWLLAWLIASVIIGKIFIKDGMMALLGRLTMAAHNGQSPFVALWESGRTILAGILLILPGVISDVIALVLLLWPSARVQTQARSGYRAHANEDIIEGEVRVVEAVQIDLKSDSK